jgi:hypothetical protein
MSISAHERPTHDRPSTIERAYQLARTGQYKGVKEIRARLKAEGYMDYVGQLEGPTLQKALRKLAEQAGRS